MVTPMPGEAQWRAHAELVGRVALASNSCVHGLLDVFRFITDIGSPLVETIYFTLGSDRAQRDLVRRVAKVRLSNKTSLKSLEDLLRRLDLVSASRNSAVHGVFGVTLFDAQTQAWGAKVVPVSHPEQRPKVPDDFQAVFEAAEAELVAVREALSHWLIWTAREFLPTEAAPEIDWSAAAASDSGFI